MEPERWWIRTAITIAPLVPLFGFFGLALIGYAPVFFLVIAVGMSFVIFTRRRRGRAR